MISNTQLPPSPDSDNCCLPSRHSEPLPLLVLEICSGRTQFPLRPVRSTRFLIGAGEGCDLQLGGTDMPPLHSIVHVDRVETLLETVALSPPLKVNGLVVESVLLQDGDQISIGPFEFVVHRRSPAAENHYADPLSADASLAGMDIETREPVDVENVSAADLADLIEREEQFVEQFQQRQRLGADALLDAIGERIASATGFEADNLDEIPADLNHVLKQVNNLSIELERHSRQLTEREEEYVEITTAVFEAQHELTTQLESLVTRLAAIETAQSVPFPKAA